MEFLKADQTCLQVCCFIPPENPNPSFSTNNGKMFLCSNRNKTKPAAFINTSRIPPIHAGSKWLCPLIYDGPKTQHRFQFLELCVSSIFDEEFKIFQRIDFFLMQIIAVSTLKKVE